MCASRLSLHSSQKHQYIVVSPKLYLYRCHFVIRDPVFLVERVESAVPHLFGTARCMEKGGRYASSTCRLLGPCSRQCLMISTLFSQVRPFQLASSFGLSVLLTRRQHQPKPKPQSPNRTLTEATPYPSLNVERTITAVIYGVYLLRAFECLYLGPVARDRRLQHKLGQGL